ncbi:N-acetyltransferase [Clostridium perfringens]|nr:N-acetyltransferase [Clostridium perfringens]NGT59432.1 N-acetyltransferase [Clostridium perfringens]
MFDINPNKLVEVENKRVVLSCGNSYVVKYFNGYPQVLKPEGLNS